MKAIVQRAYGAPDRVLRLEDVARPAVGEDDVLVRVRASSVNALDWRRVRGAPFVVRFDEGLRRPRNPVPGVDVAGHVEEVGKNVADLRPGDAVFGARNGAFAEYVSGRNFVAKPASLTFEEAAAVPVAGQTALQAVRDKAAVTSGERVLVNGAGGGVGVFIVQLAKAFGAEVTAVTRTGNVELMRTLGADRVLDYTRDDFTKRSERYDAILDVGGTPSLAAIARALSPTGRLVMVGAGKGPLGPLGRLGAGVARAAVLRQPILPFLSKASRDDVIVLRQLIEAGKLRPVIDRSYALGDAAQAILYVETERARGKVVITV